MGVVAAALQSITLSCIRRHTLGGCGIEVLTDHRSPWVQEPWNANSIMGVRDRAKSGETIEFLSWEFAQHFLKRKLVFHLLEAPSKLLI